MKTINLGEQTHKTTKESFWISEQLSQDLAKEQFLKESN